MNKIENHGETLRPFNMTLRRSDGYTARIVEIESRLEITVTSESATRTWRGVRDTIDEGLALMVRMIEDEKARLLTDDKQREMIERWR